MDSMCLQDNIPNSLQACSQLLSASAPESQTQDPATLWCCAPSCPDLRASRHFREAEAKAKVPPPILYSSGLMITGRKFPVWPMMGVTRRNPVSFFGWFCCEEQGWKSAVLSELPTPPPPLPPTALLLLWGSACSHNTNWGKNPIIHFPWGREKHART